MEVIVLKYVQLVCITIFMRNNANCAQLMSNTEEMNNLKVTACAAECLHVAMNSVSLILPFVWNYKFDFSSSILASETEIP